MTELQAVAADPRVKRIPTDEAGKESARTLYNILALLTTKGPRKMVREVPEQNGYEAYRSLVLRYGSRDAHGESTLLIKEMNFNFGDIDVMETKFEKFNLLIKEHDELSGTDNGPDTIKRAILVARAPEPLRTHLQLNSQSYTIFLEMRQAINQYLKAHISNSWSKMTRWTLILFTKKARKAMGKETTRAKESPKARAKDKANKMRKERVLGKASRIRKSSKVYAETVARHDTSGANVGRSRETSEQCR